MSHYCHSFPPPKLDQIRVNNDSIHLPSRIFKARITGPSEHFYYRQAGSVMHHLTFHVARFTPASRVCFDDSIHYQAFYQHLWPRVIDVRRSGGNLKAEVGFWLPAQHLNSHAFDPNPSCLRKELLQICSCRFGKILRQSVGILLTPDGCSTSRHSCLTRYGIPTRMNSLMLPNV